MEIRPIKTDEDYQAALRAVEELMHATLGTPEGDKLDVLATLIEVYEARHFSIPLPCPVVAIKFEMERQNLTVKDLVPLIGKSNRVYEILSHKRPLTLKMIRNLHQALGIPAALLIQETGHH